MEVETLINANELRIGNWVYDFAQNPVQVIRLTKGKQPLETPIPLTKEILEKCGFEKNYESQPGMEEFVLDKESLNLIITQENEKWFYWNHAGLMIEPQYKYLHEIQNLYFALTGEELKIDLT